jgi:hypothetical protein
LCAGGNKWIGKVIVSHVLHEPVGSSLEALIVGEENGLLAGLDWETHFHQLVDDALIQLDSCNWTQSSTIIQRNKQIYLVAVLGGPAGVLR